MLCQGNFFTSNQMRLSGKSDKSGESKKIIGGKANEI